MIEPDPPNLELTLRAAPEGGGYLADLRLRQSDSAADVEVAAALPVAIDLAALRAEEADARAYGELLQKMLFGDRGMSEAWARVAGYVQGANTGLRIRLRFDPSADVLHGVRWETLPNPATGLPLCRSQRVVFSRYLGTADLSRVERPKQPSLRALVVIASPSDLEDYNLAPIDVEAELARVREALGDLPQVTLAPPPF